MSQRLCLLLGKKENSNFSVVSLACWKLKVIFSHAARCTSGRSLSLTPSQPFKHHGSVDRESHPSQPSTMAKQVCPTRCLRWWEATSFFWLWSTLPFAFSVHASRAKAFALREKLYFFPVILKLSTLHIWEVLLSNSLSDGLWLELISSSSRSV